MYRNVLVPVADDDTPARADAALSIARLLMDPEATLTILHVREAIPGYVAASIPEAVIKTATEKAQEMVNAVAARAGVSSKGLVIAGHGGGSIVDYATRTNADCIVISSHRPEIEDVFFGSTAAHVVRHAPCAVHVLR